MAGVAYLLWLAWKAFTSRAAISGATTMAYESPGRLYRRGLATCLLNPRIVVTYSALLPQFIHPSAGSVLGQTLALGVVQIAAAATAHSFVILSASAVASALSRRPLFARARRFLLGTVLLGIAFRIAAERRTAV
jgi:threonine/homoserine/homoserine lactone efflux protein